jgi:hypothetical protein
LRARELDSVRLALEQAEKHDKGLQGLAGVDIGVQNVHGDTPLQHTARRAALLGLLERAVVPIIDTDLRFMIYTRDITQVMPCP